MIRVLIVDDSPTQRLLVRAILERDADLAVVGEARSGEEAVRACPRLQPDLLTMDINMPGMDGYEAIRQIMSESPRPIIVLTSLGSQPLVEISFKALQLGALVALAKPAGLPPEDRDARNLIAQIKLMAEVKVVRRAAGKPPAGSPGLPLRAPALAGPPEIFRLAVLGISTGGPPALQVLLNQLTPSFSVPLVIVQHISRGFVTGLAAWLNQTTPLPCKVIEPGDILRPGRVYLAPDDRHVIVKPAGLVWLDASEPVKGHRPAVNLLFQSAARNYGAAAIGVLMTGMGEDGAQGLLAMRQAGAYTLAQDEGSSVVFGMPKAAIDLGAAQEVLPLESLGSRLMALAGA